MTSRWDGLWFRMLAGLFFAIAIMIGADSLRNGMGGFRNLLFLIPGVALLGLAATGRGKRGGLEKVSEPEEL